MPRRINPATGRGFRKSRSDVEALEDAILDICYAESPLTLRRLHYALVSLGVQPNTLSDYRMLSQRTVKMRRAGLIDRGRFVDNIRETLVPHMYTSLDEALAGLRRNYRRDPWQGLDSRVLIMVEKDAIRGALWPTCSRLGVSLGIARGRASESWLETLTESINDDMANEYEGGLYVAYLGDWDPTGWANPANIEERMRGFLDEPDRLDFSVIGLNEQQIVDLSLPTAMAAKKTDPNYKNWPGGDVAVEVDAVPVATLQSWVSDFIEVHLNEEDLELAKTAAAADLERLNGYLNPDT